MLLVNQLSGFGILTFAKEARAIIDATSVQPNMARMRTIDLTVRGFLGAALWPKVDAMWFLAAHDEQAGRLNWKDPGNFTLTAVNTVTFTTDRGFAGDGSTGYLDTGWDRATNGVQFTRDNAHISVYQRTNGNNNVPPFADNQAGPRVAVGARPVNTGGGSALVNSATSVAGPAAGTLPIHAMGRRNSSTHQSLIRDGVEVTGPTAATSGALGSADLVFGKYGNVFTNAQVAGGSVGAYLDDAEALTFYKIWLSYMRAVGADT